ncbi:hypothetical protein ANN_13685 [Periplaneta americana]|uniref:Uncharacterized protein n=1 Tax=Periplaneta americana TaxID=6978 RepID=A0ABQ8SVQ9_PERAM|nr:hypothetical protein ANN_13685 [Periplaneta americana]
MAGLCEGGNEPRNPNLRRRDVMEDVSQRRRRKDTKDRVQLSLEWREDMNGVQFSARETEHSLNHVDEQLEICTMEPETNLPLSMCGTVKTLLRMQ